MEKLGVGTAHAVAAGQGQKQTAAAATKVYMQLTGPQGKVYLVEEGDLGKLQTLSGAPAPAGFAGLATDTLPSTSSVDDTEWEGWMATVVQEEISTSID